MAPLTERQLTAQSLASELGKIGAWCISSLPLDASANLRFQVLDSERDAVLAKVMGVWGWNPRPCNFLPRVCLDGTMKPSTVYEIAIEKERPVVIDRRVPRYEVISEKGRAEIAAFKKLRLS
jgi:hypothetical protein